MLQKLLLTFKVIQGKVIDFGTNQKRVYILLVVSI